MRLCFTFNKLCKQTDRQTGKQINPLAALYAANDIYVICSNEQHSLCPAINEWRFDYNAVEMYYCTSVPLTWSCKTPEAPCCDTCLIGLPHEFASSVSVCAVIETNVSTATPSGTNLTLALDFIRTGCEKE